MATYTQIFYHIVYSTKYRKPTLLKPNRNRLFKFMWGVLDKQNCHLYRINGIEDHLHIFTSVHPSLSLSTLVKDLKLASTSLIKQETLFSEWNGWQDGYHAFTHSNKDKNRLIEYIKHQENHHKNRTFKEELKALFNEHSINFEESYLD